MESIESVNTAESMESMKAEENMESMETTKIAESVNSIREKVIVDEKKRVKRLGFALESNMSPTLGEMSSRSILIKAELSNLESAVNDKLFTKLIPGSGWSKKYQLFLKTKLYFAIIYSCM